jgi:hypothetical protein
MQLYLMEYSALMGASTAIGKCSAPEISAKKNCRL